MPKKKENLFNPEKCLKDGACSKCKFQKECEFKGIVRDVLYCKQVDPNTWVAVMLESDVRNEINHNGNHPEFIINCSDVKENVNHPKHYNMGQFEVIDVIEDWDLNFNLGNAIKYVARAGHKGEKNEDLKKAIWYIQREIDLKK